MKIKFLNWFGLTTLSTYREIEDRAKDYHKLICDLTIGIAEYESKLKPEVEFVDYKSDERDGSEFNKKLFDEWYSIYCKNQYQAYKIRQLIKHPHLLNAFMNEFSSFNWSDIYLYMEENKWFWDDGDKIPTIEELKDCVITLIPENDFNYIGNNSSNAGFKVILYYNVDGEAICKIEFKK